VVCARRRVSSSRARNRRRGANPIAPRIEARLAGDQSAPRANGFVCTRNSSSEIVGEIVGDVVGGEIVGEIVC
jgi:hypothetical protein